MEILVSIGIKQINLDFRVVSEITKTIFDYSSLRLIGLNINCDKDYPEDADGQHFYCHVGIGDEEVNN